MVICSICLSLFDLLKLIPFRFIYIVANSKIEFIFMFYMFDYIYHIFIGSLVDRHLGGFHILHIVNDAVNNIGVHVSFPIRVFIWEGIYTRIEFLDQRVILF